MTDNQISVIAGVPAHCLNNNCEWFNSANIPQGTRWYLNHGYYFSAQHGKVPRYRCTKCGRTFSLRSMQEECYLHFDNIDIPKIGKAWLEGKSLGDIARENGITTQMVRTRLKRFEVHFDDYINQCFEGPPRQFLSVGENPADYADS